MFRRLEGKASSNEQESYKALEVQNGSETRLASSQVDDFGTSRRYFEVRRFKELASLILSVKGDKQDLGMAQNDLIDTTPIILQ